MNASSTLLPEPVGPDDQGMTDIADMQREAERGRALGPRMEQRWSAKMSIAVLSAHTADTGMICARLRVETGGWRTLA